MYDFGLWFSTGWHHIIDVYGYDHILYIMVLTALYTYKEWKLLLALITAFTIGHSATLAASTYQMVQVKSGFIEMLIPVTIMVTCLYNLFNRNRNIQNMRVNYILALCFGFIHGMGFSYSLRSMLGHEDKIWFPLLSFNLGLEVGQIFIVLLTLGLMTGLVLWFKIKKTAIITTLSSVVLMLSIYLLFNRINEI